MKVSAWDGVIAGIMIVAVWRGDEIFKIVSVFVLVGYMLLRPMLFRQLAGVGVSGDDNDFLLEHTDLEHRYVEIDTDINRRPAPNHFRYYGRYDTSLLKSEFEYRVEGNEVSARLIHELGDSIGDPKTWNVRDGVVQEIDVTARMRRNSTYDDGDIAKEIADLKKRTEWFPITAITFSGLKYFILSKKMPEADKRRYFRQEIECYRQGIALCDSEAAKIGVQYDESTYFYTLADGRDEPTPEVMKGFHDTIAAAGYSNFERERYPVLITQLQKLLGDA